MEERPNYFAIIPANIRYDNELRANEKLLYGEITSLAKATGECWASNKYFSELYGVKTNAIITWIRHLKEKGYISVDYEYQGKEIKKRIITIVGGIQMNRPSYLFEYGGTIQKGVDNNTSINNINNNKYIVEQVLDYLNEKTNSNYKKTTKSTIQKINARIKEGFSLEDFKTVIDKKCDEWKGTALEQYLRPDTLFGTKFESYLNQNIIKKQKIETRYEKEKRILEALANEEE